MGSLAKAYCHHNIPFHHYRPYSNLQYPISPFAITSPSINTPSDQSHLQNPNNKQPQFGQFIIPTLAITASAWFFLRLRQNPPIITAPVDLHLELEEEGAVKELPLVHKPGYVEALHFFKIKPGMVLKLIDVYDSDNYESLKARLRLSAECLETTMRELEEVVGIDPGRVLEYSQDVDELMGLLKNMEVCIDKCGKDNIKGYFRSCYRLLALARIIEAEILNVLKEFPEDDEEEEEGGGES